MKKLDVIISGDGSSTIVNHDLNETYHSTKGALAESLHVFIQNGIEYYTTNSVKNEVNILEIGMGTGLNAILTYLYAIEKKLVFKYFTLEPYPLSADLLSQLNYKEVLNERKASDILDMIHETDWETFIDFSHSFQFHKSATKIQDFVWEPIFNLVYFDAFAPKKQPELWEENIFVKLFSLLTPGGCLVSYCASGQFKRNLKAAGFLVETLQGPPGKKEMTRAIKV